MGRCLSPTLLWSVPPFSHCWTPSPLQSHWGRWYHTHLSGLLVYLHFMWGVPLPPSPVEPSTRQPLLLAFPTPGCWVWAQLLPSLAGLFIYSLCGECPCPTLWSSGCPTLFATCLFFSAACLLFSFFHFSHGGGQSVQGAMLICSIEYHMPLICSPGGLPSRLEAGVWPCGSPPGFSI
jgi:hypothetical protein